eukprot:401989-Karenia_brevis.AAC.1
MRKSVVSPDVFSFGRAISACKEGGQWQRVAPLLDEMRRGSVWPDVFSFGVAIPACEEGWQWQRVAPLLDETVSYTHLTLPTICSV